MKPLPLSLALAAAVLALVVGGCGGGSGDVPSDAVAVVDGIEIPRSDLDELVEQAKRSIEAGDGDFPNVGTPEYQGYQQRSVAFLVQKTEFEQAAAADFDIEVTDEDVDKARADFLKSRSWDEKKLAGELEKEGLSEEGFRKTLRVSVLSQKIFDAVTKDVKVSDQDALAAYTQRQDEFRTKDSRDVRHILVSEKTKDGQIDFAKSKTEADRIYGLLQDGGDFAALARQFSEDTGSKDSGGKVTFSKGEFVPEFEKVSFELKTGEIAPPVKTVYGYHVIEALSDIRPARVTPFKQVKDPIKAQLLQDKRNAAMTEWVQDLQKRYEGKVSYAAGFEPPELPEPTATETE